MQPALHNEDLVAMLCEMIKARVASDRLWSLQRQGRIGTIAPIDGQEATTVGATWALEPAEDWVIPQYLSKKAFITQSIQVRNTNRKWYTKMLIWRMPTAATIIRAKVLR